MHASVQAMPWPWLMACTMICNSAGLAVTGDWTCRKDPRVHRIGCIGARALFLLMQAVGHEVKVEQFAAHIGDLMNEVPDCAAKAEAQYGPCYPWLRDDWRQALASDLVELLWLLPWHARS